MFDKVIPDMWCVWRWRIQALSFVGILRHVHDRNPQIPRVCQGRLFPISNTANLQRDFENVAEKEVKRKVREVQIDEEEEERE